MENIYFHDKDVIYLKLYKYRTLIILNEKHEGHVRNLSYAVVANMQFKVQNMYILVFVNIKD